MDKPLGSGFGVQVKEWRTTDKDLDAIQDMGAEFLRFGFVWPAVEIREGVYDWREADALMNQLADRGM